MSVRDRALILLALGDSTDQVGRVVGVDGSTVRRWRQRPDFQAEVQRVRIRLLNAAVTAVAGGDVR